MNIKNTSGKEVRITGSLEEGDQVVVKFFILNFYYIKGYRA